MITARTDRAGGPPRPGPGSRQSKWTQLTFYRAERVPDFACHRDHRQSDARRTGENAGRRRYSRRFCPVSCSSMTAQTTARCTDSIWNGTAFASSSRPTASKPWTKRRESCPPSSSRTSRCRSSMVGTWSADSRGILEPGTFPCSRSVPMPSSARPSAPWPLAATGMSPNPVCLRS